MTPAEKIKKLTADILAWDDAYYGSGATPVSDAVYDAAKMQLKELETQHPDLQTPDSPTLTIGKTKAETVAGYRKVAHHVPMLSLDTKVDTSIQPIKDFLSKIGDSRTLENLYTVAEPKYDGLGLDLQYVGGLLREAVTRGDGYDGEDVLRHIVFIGSIPQKLPLPLTCDIRGEVTLGKEDLIKINAGREKQGARLYTNPRNAAAGLVRMKQADPVHSFLRFMAYEIAYGDLGELGDSQYSHVGRMDFLDKAGFNVSFKAISHKGGDKDVIAKSLYEFYEKLLEERSTLPYDIDGVVYKINNITLREELGFTGREPNWAFAHKFVPDRAITRVADIRIGVGKTGRITPVAMLDPVFVGGAVVSNATLVHEERIKELGVKIGDRVLIQRAGDVIPEIIEVLEPDGVPLDTQRLFAHCPDCGSALEKEGAFYYCRAGSNCPGQVLAVLEMAVSRGYLNIQGLGASTVDALHAKGYLRDVGDIFSLTHEKLVDAGMSPLLTAEVLQHVQAAKKLPLWRITASLGIPGCGRTASKELVKKYSTLAELEQAQADDLQQLPDIGPITAQSIVTGMQVQKETLSKLKAMDSNWTSSQVVSNGLSVCITGSLPGWDRTDLKNRLEAVGYKTVDSVSKKTNILIAGEGAGTKLAKAQELGIRIITTNEEVQTLLS